MLIPTFLFDAQNRLIASLSSLGALVGLRVFASADDWMAKIGGGSCIGVCCIVATAYFKTRGGTIKAMSDAKIAEADLLRQTTKETIERIVAANADAIARLERDLAYARTRADTAEQIQHEITVAKHTAVEETFALAFHVRLLEELLTEAGKPFPTAPAVTVGRAVRAADASTSRLLAKRAEATKAQTQAILLPPTVEI